MSARRASRAACAALLLVAAAAPSQPKSAAKTDEQRELDARLEKERAAAAQLSQRESGLLGKLAELERQVEVEGRALRAAQARLRVADGRLSSSERRARAADDEVARASRELAPRLIARYRLGREGYVRFLLGARSVTEVLRRRRLFSAILERDFDALDDLHLRSEQAKAARDELARSRDELSGSAAVEQERRSALEARATQQRRMLAQVQQEKGLHEQAIRELEEAARALAQQIAELQKKRSTSPDAAGARGTAASGGSSAGPTGNGPSRSSREPPVRSARGRLLFPVPGGQIEARFGRAIDPRFGTVTLQRGIDVRAPEGAPVRAVHGGTVVHAGWFRGYGNLMIIDHGDGVFSLMAHLATLDRGVGDQVRRGDQLGTVGDTGSLKGSYLYFELRDGQKPFDPEPWLAKARVAAKKD
ncbi:MAG TPA: peptidoglycan DD-metalloendopeptidase family protein [Myxococcales bacterium]|nr:peptidoglycan DD-metalloendopeptidase family protein [Myxococcales bacterium]